ncbi:murein hydrolase activator NlpD [Gallibacterium salpingitidis]|uniref:murein hydrolase activator NlpD n=1 Tax=Gallibacterium salpingitidis TaxID=505341 RepID=UPI00266FFF19|nr:murein hydrolase activator NlpD [Gallibacterium salpingitidis]WKS99501.1 murein hydrolase activator NlpD [Gallibacterium salpingitidis]
MKQSFLLVPVLAAILAGCSSNNSAPVEDADGTLTPGIMQSVGNDSNSTWEPQVQQQQMPTDMMATTPAATSTPTQQPVSQPQPTYQQPAPVTTTPKPVATAPAAKQQISQDFTIPRNPQTNAPDYSKIDKGFYKGSTYTVRKGDTMFLIAYISGMDVRDLAALNNIPEPYKLSVGQTLKVSNNAASTATASAPATTTSTATATAQPQQPAVTYTPGPNGTAYGSDGTIVGPIKSTASTIPPATNNSTNTVPVTAEPTTTVSQPVTTMPAATSNTSNITWIWPTKGNVIQGFSNSDGGNKGIDIGGSRGQAVYAAAPGRVVYAGNALRGYGNLIIIKHNDDYLSAYAHNETILVKDQQQVTAGQQIAKMGSSGTNSVKLHFEIRYKGKSVNPTTYLPRN